MRRLVSIVLVLLALVAATAVPARSDTWPIIGRIATTYTAAGGADKFGAPLGAEVKLTLSGRNLYHQRLTKGIVFWSSYAGGRTAVYPAMLGMSGVSHERDALARYGYRPGLVFRSGRLCGATAKDKQLLLAQLHGVAIVDLRTDGTAANCPDPSIGVTRVRYPVASDAIYPRYVTYSSRRAAFGKALKKIEANAVAGKPTLVHCTAGKDRTGWTIVVLMSILGADQADIYREYLRTSGADEADLVEGLDKVATTYGGGWEHGVTGAGMYRYVRALGLTDADIDALRRAL